MSVSAGGQPMQRPALRKVFKHLNKLYMVPTFKLGLAAPMLNPMTGYIMVLQTTGRKTGTPRFTPLNYALLDGNIYCLAGWGARSHWYANLKADPHVQVMMASGTIISGVAEEVTDPDEISRAALRVARNAGFATMFEGMNPLTISDEELLSTLTKAPVVRVRPRGVVPGLYDPGGRGWVLPALLRLLAALWLAGSLLRRRGRARSY